MCLETIQLWHCLLRFLWLAPPTTNLISTRNVNSSNLLVWQERVLKLYFISSVLPQKFVAELSHYLRGKDKLGTTTEVGYLNHLCSSFSAPIPKALEVRWMDILGRTQLTTQHRAHHSAQTALALSPKPFRPLDISVWLYGRDWPHRKERAAARAPAVRKFSSEHW